MPNGLNFANDLARHIGQTVTIFTTSGGESGRGFTGVLASVNDRFVRLITQLGSAPGCALGNCCDERHERRSFNRNEEFGEENFQNENLQGIEEFNRRDRDRDRDRDRERNRFDCSGRTLGSIVDIPIDRIASFVHNAVGSGW
ncbi:hypothetical protein JK636_02140 [Clostridium sp. YIM B02515]|uniref:Uncharacterized protein n=1 Tax=Clostridium rhizosphaerae TaxID=2803861 RepID=A0ABS1T5E9_9CLOT|nr:hypothetical protein [Clostridium rhizosphaerae]MBL4934554.1 hypothetical protein [Clostridium rhizosphaerae]